MGKYINTNGDTALRPKNKAQQLIDCGLGKEITQAEAEKLVEGGQVVCVVDNGIFDAAAWCYDMREFADFTEPGDTRPKRWLLVPLAEKLSG